MSSLAGPFLDNAASHSKVRPVLGGAFQQCDTCGLTSRMGRYYRRPCAREWVLALVLQALVRPRPSSVTETPEDPS